MPLPQDVPLKRLNLTAHHTPQERWRKLISYLEDKRPCVYIPNYDVDCSCISPALPAEVGIIGAVRSDEAFHFEHAMRLGRYWDRIMTVSSYLKDQLVSRCPEWADKIVCIHNGVELGDLSSRTAAQGDGRLRILFANRIDNAQKRVFDIPEIARLLAEAKVPFQLTVVGNGPDKGEFLRRMEPFICNGTTIYHDTVASCELIPYYRKADVFLLTSGFEGMPNSLLEAMAYGCVPVSSNLKSGVPEIIEHGVNGLLAGVGDVREFARHLAWLHAHREESDEMSRRAYKTIEDRFTFEQTVSGWLALCDDVRSGIREHRFVRPAGKIKVPPHMAFSNRVRRRIARLTESHFSAGKLGK
jgi:glycosyltransferase involved in cell wall biosynthesis